MEHAKNDNNPRYGKKNNGDGVGSDQFLNRLTGFVVKFYA